MELTTPIDSLPHTSIHTIKRMESLGIETFYDLLNYFPTRYENYLTVKPLTSLADGEITTVRGRVISAKQIFTRRSLRIQKVTISDGNGHMELVWFNQPYLMTLFRPNTLLSLSGEVKKELNTFSMHPKEYEVLQSEDQETIHTGRILPIYSEKRGLSSHTIREKIFYVLSRNAEVKEWFPQEIVSKHNLEKETFSYRQIHFPQNTESLKKGKERLSFDEFFTIQLASQLVKKEWEQEKVTNRFLFTSNIPEKIQEFTKQLPFELTDDQKLVTKEILSDLAGTKPMNRFLQGEVGSGKTVVATIGAYTAYLNKLQTLIMAPTEILAQQHYHTLSQLLKKYPIKVALQTSSQKMISSKKEAKKMDIIIGTQALLNESLDFARVGFVVIDEQHRFGVQQRATLKKKGTNPHLLTMTATPIPRTVMLTIYGELDQSVIRQMPKGRLPVKTYLVPPEKREKGYEWIKEKIRQEKIQVFIVCPLIEESEKETMKSIRAATKEYEFLKLKVFEDFKVSLLHGRLKSKEKEQIMKDFKDKKSDILISTSVVEVGIDIANATIMIIEGADRFGLAQLHQLRGRVGRGDKQSYCFLYTETTEPASTGRLRFFANTQHGIDLAEYDLKRRGPGEMYGTRQHGYSELKIANFFDHELIKKAKESAQLFIEKYSLDRWEGVKERVEKLKVGDVSQD